MRQKKLSSVCCWGNIFIAFLMVIVMAGCVPLMIGAAAGLGGAAYVKGALETRIDNSVKEVHEASLAGLKDLGLFVFDDDLTRHSAVINAEFENGEKVRIEVKALTEYVSELKIRVGFFGDETKSFFVLDAIQKNL